jgi:hypothetical protein
MPFLDTPGAEAPGFPADCCNLPPLLGEIPEELDASNQFLQPND